MLISAATGVALAGGIMYHLFFVDMYGCAYEWEVCASSAKEARHIWSGYDWSGVGDVDTIIYLRVVEV